LTESIALGEKVDGLSHVGCSLNLEEDFPLMKKRAIFDATAAAVADLRD
jgi:hypothetical protein